LSFSERLADSLSCILLDPKSRAEASRVQRRKKLGQQIAAIMPAGVMADKASAIFAAPEEIAKMIEARC
jgi:hypothetical protein